MSSTMLNADTEGHLARFCLRKLARVPHAPTRASGAAGG